MKKIIKPGVPEVAEDVCDVTGKPAVAVLRLWFGYGSNQDMNELRADLSAEVADEILALIQARFPMLKLTEYNFFQRDNPLAGWDGELLEYLRKQISRRDTPGSAEARRVTAARPAPAAPAKPAKRKASK